MTIGKTLLDTADFIREGLSGYRLKKPGQTDDETYSYELVEPKVYVGDYGLVDDIREAVPSVLIEVGKQEFTRETMTCGMTLTLAVWDSGIHPKDEFRPVPGIPGEYQRGIGEGYEKATWTAALDIVNFLDVVCAHIRKNGSRAGLSVSFRSEVVRDDELAAEGYRTARIEIEASQALPSDTRSTEEAQQDMDIERFLY